MAVVALSLSAVLFIRMALQGFDLHLVSAALWFVFVAITLRPKAPRGLAIAGIGVWLGGLAAAAIRWLYSPPSDVAASGNVIVFFIIVIIPAVALLGVAVAILAPSSPRRPKRTESDEEPVVTAPSGLPLTMRYGDAQSRRPAYTTSDGGGWLGGAGVLIGLLIVNNWPKIWPYLTGESATNAVPAAVVSQPKAPKVIVPTAKVQPPPEKPAPVETQPEDGRLGSPFASFVEKFGQPTKTYAGGATWDGVGGLRSLRVYGDPSGANEIRYEAEEGYFTFTKACDIVVANSQGHLWSPAVEVSKVNEGMMGLRTIYFWYRSDGGFASFQTTRGAVGNNRAAISYAESDGDSVVVRRPSSDAAKNIENYRKYSTARNL